MFARSGTSRSTSPNGRGRVKSPSGGRASRDRKSKPVLSSEDDAVNEPNQLSVATTTSSDEPSPRSPASGSGGGGGGGGGVFDRLSKSYTASYARQLQENEQERSRSRGSRRGRYSARTSTSPRPQRRTVPNDLGDEAPPAASTGKTEEELEAQEQARLEAARIFERLSQTNTASSALRRRREKARVPQVHRNFVSGKANTGYVNRSAPDIRALSEDTGRQPMTEEDRRMRRSADDATTASIFERLSHAQTESIQKKRSEKRTHETQRNFVAGVVRRSASDMDVASGSGGLNYPTSPLSDSAAMDDGSASARRSRSRPLSGNNVYERLTSREAMTGIARRLHSDKSRSRLARARRLSRSALHSPGTSPRHRQGSASISSVQSDGNVIRQRRKMNEMDLLQDIVSVLTDPAPAINREELLGGLRQRLEVENITRASHPKWKACLHRIITRHVRATQRNLDDPECKAMVSSSAPSARNMCSMLASAMGERLDQHMGEIFRIKVLGDELLVVRANRHSMNTAAINRHFFGDDQRVLQKHGAAIYCLTIGKRKFVGSVGHGHTVASRVSAHIRAAFFCGTDEAETFELSQALRVTPIEGWRGAVLESFVKVPADLDLVTQVQIFEQGAYFPLGLNTVVNERLREMIVQKNVPAEWKAAAAVKAKPASPSLKSSANPAAETSVSSDVDNDDGVEVSMSHMDLRHRAVSIDKTSTTAVTDELREFSDDDDEEEEEEDNNGDNSKNNDDDDNDDDNNNNYSRRRQEETMASVAEEYGDDDEKEKVVSNHTRSSSVDAKKKHFEQQQQAVAAAAAATKPSSSAAEKKKWKVAQPPPYRSRGLSAYDNHKDDDDNNDGDDDDNKKNNNNDDDDHHHTKHKAATHIQKRYKGHRVRKDLKQKTHSATKIQAVFRGHRARKHEVPRYMQATQASTRRASQASVATLLVVDREDDADDEVSGMERDDTVTITASLREDDDAEPVDNNDDDDDDDDDAELNEEDFETF